MVLTERYRRFFQSENPSQRKLLFFTRLMAFAEAVFFALVILLVLINFAFGKSSQPGDEKLITSDSSDYFTPHSFRYENFVYVPNIKTVRFCQPEKELTQPIIRLSNSQDLLQFSFDDLDGGERTYNYKIIHCNFEWIPSDLLENQFHQGYSDVKISDARFSINTFQHYTHYQFNFPNESMAPVISGNFLMIIYSDNDPDKVVITRRFMVLDQKVSVLADVHRATKISERNSRQEVDFSIFHPDYKIDNPFTDLKVAIFQNDRTDNVITGLQPLFLKDHELDYDYEEGNVFDGGNEFRSFDTRSLESPGQQVKKITRDTSVHHVFLMNDSRRSSYQYIAGNDINGAFVIRTDDAKSDILEADYCQVHFFFPVDAPFAEGNLYVFGSFCDWRLDEKNRLKYNEEEHGYEVALILKQGYYNYEYIFAGDGFETARGTELEGNHAETENSYMICVYNKPMNGRYDELIGLKRFNTISN